MDKKHQSFNLNPLLNDLEAFEHELEHTFLDEYGTMLVGSPQKTETGRNYLKKSVSVKNIDRRRVLGSTD